MADAKTKTTDEGWTDVDYHEFPDKITDWSEPGQDVIGTLLWREVVDTEGLDGNPRKSTMYAIETASGEVGVWGTANLDPQLATVADGTQVKITYLGKSKIKAGREMHRFVVATR